MCGIEFLFKKILSDFFEKVALWFRAINPSFLYELTNSSEGIIPVRVSIKRTNAFSTLEMKTDEQTDDKYIAV